MASVFKVFAEFSPYPGLRRCIKSMQALTTIVRSQTANAVRADTGEQCTEGTISTHEVKSVAQNVESEVLSERKWHKRSRRTGLVGIKLGMTQLWNKEGSPIAVTVLQVFCIFTKLSVVVYSVVQTFM